MLPEMDVPPRPRLLLLSAESGPALAAEAADLADRLEAVPGPSLAETARGLRARPEHPHRRAVVAADRAAAIEGLRDAEARHVRSGRAGPPPRDVAFLFSGQGAQYVDMARGLYEGEPTFRATFNRCADLFARHVGRDLRAVVYPAEGDRDEAAARLKETALTQPALFAVEYALASVWTSWGVQPAAMAGHSVGEYVAACLAGVFPLEDAVELVAARGRLMQELPPGAMRIVNLDEEDLRARLVPGVSIAAVNAPGLCVVAGPFDAIAAFERTLAASGLEARPLQTSHAFHSAMMEPILPRFTEHVARARRTAPAIPFLSNVSGDWITEAQATDPAYWARHLRGAVRFADCAARLLARPGTVLLEVGPGRTLQTLALLHPARKPDHVVLASTRQPKRRGDDLAVLLTALAEAWVAGVAIDRAALDASAEA